jgi:hypothetical protein
MCWSFVAQASTWNSRLESDLMYLLSFEAWAGGALIAGLLMLIAAAFDYGSSMLTIQVGLLLILLSINDEDPNQDRISRKSAKMTGLSSSSLEPAVLEPFDLVSEAFQIVLDGEKALLDRFDFRSITGVE